MIAIDTTLIDHTGKLIEDVGYSWDHAEHRHVIAHDYLFANSVLPNGRHYPLDFQRFRKREQCDTDHPFRNHTDLTKELIDWAVAEQIPGDFTFDSSFTNAPIMNRIHGRQRTYIGDLKANRVILVSGQETTMSVWTKILGPLLCTKFTVVSHTQWYFTKSIRIPKVTHPMRILVLWPDAEANEPRKVLITNQTHWEAHRILKVYKHRWTGTEPFHRDGKQHLCSAPHLSNHPVSLVRAIARCRASIPGTTAGSRGRYGGWDPLTRLRAPAGWRLRRAVLTCPPALCRFLRRLRHLGATLLRHVLLWAPVTERLVWPLRVVPADPGGDRLLCCREVGKHGLPDAFLFQTPKESLDNGIIANDKFCLTRCSQLLRGRMRPSPPVLQPSYAPAHDIGKPQEDGDGCTTTLVEDPASSATGSPRSPALGTGVSAVGTLECSRNKRGGTSGG